MGLSYMMDNFYIHDLYSQQAYDNQSTMKISPSAKAMIQSFEAFRPHAYKDGSGIRTIGYGHVILPSEDMLFFVNKKQALEILDKDIRIAENCVKELIPFPLDQNQFDALVSLVFNIGCGAFKTSNVYKYLKQQNFMIACAYWREWVRGRNKIALPSLALRRQKEIELFNM